jgi:diacylglycerol kinase (ATP)
MRVTLIHNPGAGDDDQPGPSELTGLVRAAGHEVTEVSCKDHDWQRSLEQPADLIAVAGGDGTIGRIAKAMAHRGVPLALLPLGTANNISRTLGVAGRPLEELVAGWARAPRRAFDVGAATGPWGHASFIEGLGMGLFVGMMQQADDEIAKAGLTQAGEKVACALQLLREHVTVCAARELEVILDGRDLSGEYLMLEAMNTQLVGPNLYLAPDADPADGLLDVVLIRKTERDKLYEYLRTWQNGHLLPADLPIHRGRNLRFKWSACELHIDDEIWPQRGSVLPATPQAVEVSMEQKALEFLVPV